MGNMVADWVARRHGAHTMENHPGRIDPLYNNGGSLGHELDRPLANARAAASALPSGDLAERETAIAALRQKCEIALVAIHVERAETSKTPRDVVVRPSNGSSQNWGGEDVVQAGLQVTVDLPYSGNSQLLQHEASRHQDVDASTRLLEGTIQLSKTFTMPTTADTIRQWRTGALAAVTANAEAANADVRTHN